MAKPRLCDDAENILSKRGKTITPEVRLKLSGMDDSRQKGWVSNSYIQKMMEDMNNAIIYGRATRTNEVPAPAPAPAPKPKPNEVLNEVPDPDSDPDEPCPWDLFG